MTFKFYKANIKNIEELKAIDTKKAEKLSGVGVTDKALAISIKNTLSAKQSIADLKEKYKLKISYSQDKQNHRVSTTIYYVNSVNFVNINFS